MQRQAPAKINLSLRVADRRDDGYHEIDTLMVPVDVADTLEVEEAGGEGELDFQCDDPLLPVDGGNLVVRAVEQFREATGWRAGLRIRLAKRIPYGAGMGGGSSDAAATLKLLREISGEEPAGGLFVLAAGLGSDVPFFLQGRAARCTGRGERVEPVDLDFPYPILLVKPPFGVSTPWAYQRFAALKSREGTGGGMHAGNCARRVGRVELVNDLEPAVFSKFLVLDEMKEWLMGRDGVEGALMSGSGSVVFAVLSPGADAQWLAGAAASRYGETFWIRACRVRQAAGLATHVNLRAGNPENQ